jgi:hypothetical protein
LGTRLNEQLATDCAVKIAVIASKQAHGQYSRKCLSFSMFP